MKANDGSAQRSARARGGGRGPHEAARRAGHGATDLGRRIREYRHQARLTRQEAAEGAGMAITYLAYLETNQDASPTPATLVRLAAALGTTSRSLAGAGMELPPGQQPPDARPLMEPMTAGECRGYLSSGGVGRFVYIDVRGPVAVPVNYRMLGDDIVFVTAASSTLAARAGQRRVSFEVDHVDDALGEGWSVLVSGRAHRVTDPAELQQVRSLGIAPWPAGAREIFIRIVAVETTGRRIRGT